MSDDLVKRLREVGGISDDGATRWYINPDGTEAADRIEKLEAALWRHACKCTKPCDSQCLHWHAKLALEGKDE